MHRRKFVQLLGAGAGAQAIAAAPAGGQQQNGKPQEPPVAKAQPDDEPPKESSEPVNVADFQDLARRTLPKASYEYISTGSMDEWTVRENVAAFQRIRIAPPLLHGVSQPDLTCTALGRRISMPILLAPVAAQRMFHPAGAVAAARAAAAEGTIYGLSSSAGSSVEEVAGAGEGTRWFQLYVPKDREVARRLIKRVERAGYAALIVTVDLGEWKDADRRNRFMLPKEMLVKHLRDVGFTQVSERMDYQQVIDFNSNAWDLSLTWDFFDWLREQTKLPLLIKGVLRPEDAAKAVSIGLDGIIVSNHGGRRLDGMPATIDVLPQIAAEVGDRAELYLDGGVRRGTDVIKALALGARAVLIGRPYAWALAADGEQGVRKLLQLLREELLSTMVATGTASASRVDKSMLT